MVELVNVGKKYRNKELFGNVNYTFSNKGVYFLNGESGSGKTTLLKIIAGLIDCEGKVVGNDNVFFLPFNDYLINEFNVDEMLKLEGEIYKENRKLKDLLDINAIKRKKCSKLSLGERQRIGIYLALNSNSQIVLLDEPFAGLDKRYRRIAQNMIKIEGKKRLFIIVSHDSMITNGIIQLRLKEGRLIGNQNTKIKNNSKKSLLDNKVSIKWAMTLHLKQIFSRFIFIISCLGILIFANSVLSENKKLQSDFDDIFSNEYIYYRKNTSELNDPIFYDVIVNSLSREINNYYIYDFSSQMYQGRALIGEYYFDNGFVFSNYGYIGNVNDNEIIIEIDRKEFCETNNLFNCSERALKDIVLGNSLSYEYKGMTIKFQIKDVIIGNKNYVYLNGFEYINNCLRSMHNNLYHNYVINVDNNKLEKFYKNLFTIESLQDFNFIKVYSDMEHTAFLISLNDRRYFNSELLEEESVVACSEIGYSCNVFDFSSFKSLVFIDDINVENKIKYSNSPNALNYDEIIISSALGQYLNKGINDKINLKFYFDEKYHVLENVRIIDILDTEEIIIYHDKYDYELFTSVFNKDLRVEYIYSNENLERYSKQNTIYYDELEDIKDYIDQMINIINIVVYFVSGLMIFFLFLIEGNKFKQHNDFFKLFYLKRIRCKYLFNTYMFFYLICSCVYLGNMYLFPTYILIYLYFYNKELKKIRSLLDLTLIRQLRY